MSVEALQEYTAISKFAFHLKDKKRRELWHEAVDRVFSMHETKYGKILDPIRDLFDNAKKAMQQKLVLGSQRVLQFGGLPVLRCEARSYNCFAKETEFISSHGVKSFANFKDGDRTKVLSQLGEWQPAIVRSFGEQQLYKIVISRGNARYEIRATKDHRWFTTKRGEVTDLAVGDHLKHGENVFADFEFDDADPTERLYWCYGFVYGDGTNTVSGEGNKYSMVRLCGQDKNYESRFTQLGFKSSSSLSLKGDVIIYTGTYQKKAPDPTIDDPRLIRAFVAGYLAADGEKNSNFCKNTELETDVYPRYLTIQSSEQDHIDFIRKCFPIAGVYIVSETELTGQVTNFGTRPYTILFRIKDSFGAASACKFRVDSIEEDTKEVVWCLNVEHDHGFTLPNGIITGNCTGSYADRPRFFQEALWLLLTGAGVGFSVQKHHIAKLPDIKKRTGKTVIHKIDDSIEGWADALGILLSSYLISHQPFPEYANCIVIFDGSGVRPRGSKLSWGAIAPGPQGLLDALDNIETLIESRLLLGTNRLRPIDAYDIMMHASDAVLSGGLRRSATLCLFSPDDEDMLNAKTGDWQDTNPQRGRSNNSALLIRGTTTKEQFSKIFARNKEFGEPGFVWADNEEFVVNPCQPGFAPLVTPDGLSNMDQIKIGDTIWSQDGWVRVTNKAYTGDKHVFTYKTTAGVFYGTEDHRVVSNGSKIEVKKSNSIDMLKGPRFEQDTFDEFYTNLGMIILGGQTRDGETGTWLRVAKKDKELSRYLREVAPTYINKKKSRRFSIQSFLTAQDLRDIDSDGLDLISGRDRPLPFKYVASILRGMFSFNGYVTANRVVLRMTSRRLVADVQTMLSSLGISSYTTTAIPCLASLHDGLHEYRDRIDININKDKALFAETVGFIQPTKQEALLGAIRRDPTTEPIKATQNIESITSLGILPVYDITVSGMSHTYWTGGLNVSNCCEIGFNCYDEFGNSGWQACNLTEINAKQCKDRETFLKACESATFLGTLQAGYTDFYYLEEPSRRIIRREALLGVSMTGMMDSPEIAFDEKLQREGAKLVLAINERVAKVLGINKAARATCVKPSGDASCILGTSSGIHAPHAIRYIRNVQANKLEPPALFFQSINPLAVEESCWSNSGTDLIISFLCEVPKNSITKNKQPALDLLERVKLTQKNWVETGTREELCTKPWLRHNVSNTIHVRPHEWDEVEDFIFKNRKWLCGISIISATGDKDYAQAPFVSVQTPEEIVEQYGPGSLMASGLIVDGLHAFPTLWKACDCVLGISTADKIDTDLKKDWVRRAKQFADRYCDGDVKRMTYLLKDVHTWKRWCDLKREWKPVDWSTFVEDEEAGVKLDENAAASCAGGACEIGDRKK